ncbi:MAG: hypothetical protein ACQEWD_11420 [Bacteroidota bacterium]
MEGLSDQLTEIEAKAKFQNINLQDNNLEDIYFNNLQVWYYRNSDKREPVSEEFEPVNFVSKDPNKLICSKMNDGIPLTEKDFIEEEIQLMSKLKKESLKRNEDKRLIKYLEFLNVKKNNISNSTAINTNPYPSIFASEKGYLIFERLNKKYIKTDNHLANYSFLFYALETDKFLLCTGTEFKLFLSKNYQIEIDKIDSRQSGTNKKTIAYEAIKDQYS